MPTDEMPVADTLGEAPFSISYVRPESHQLFFLFVGVLEALTVHALDFLRGTAIGDRNIVILKDPYNGHCYTRGVSEEYDSLEGIVRWQRQHLAECFPHVREIFCVGASAGGGAAIYTACQLGARAAWSLGGRIVKPELVVERDRALRALYQRVIGRPTPHGMTPEEHARLVEAFATPDVRQQRWNLSGNPDTVVARDRTDSLVALLQRSRAPTQFHFYYARTNVIDRQFAEPFRDCPNVTLHAVEAPPYDWSQDVTFRDRDHNIVQMLLQMGRLRTLFAPYV